MKRPMSVVAVMCALLSMGTYAESEKAGQATPNQINLPASRPLEELMPLASRGDPEAQYDLGSKYLLGWGNPMDRNNGLKWLRLAAEQRHVNAQALLGALYGSEDGIRNDKEAVKWLRLAAAQDHRDAQLHLAKMYAAGRGVRKDRIIALALCRVSTAMNRGPMRFEDTQQRQPPIGPHRSGLPTAMTPVEIEKAAALEQQMREPSGLLKTLDAPAENRVVGQTVITGVEPAKRVSILHFTTTVPAEWAPARREQTYILAAFDVPGKVRVPEGQGIVLPIADSAKMRVQFFEGRPQTVLNGLSAVDLGTLQEMAAWNDRFAGPGASSSKPTVKKFEVGRMHAVLIEMTGTLDSQALGAVAEQLLITGGRVGGRSTSQRTFTDGCLSDKPWPAPAITLTVASIVGIVATPKGNVTFTLDGDNETVAANKPALLAMLNGLK